MTPHTNTTISITVQNLRNLAGADLRTMNPAVLAAILRDHLGRLIYELRWWYWFLSSPGWPTDTLYDHEYRLESRLAPSYYGPS